MTPVQLRPHYRLWMLKTFPFMVLPYVKISLLTPGFSLECPSPNHKSSLFALDPTLSYSLKSRTQPQADLSHMLNKYSLNR